MEHLVGLKVPQRVFCRVPQQGHLGAPERPSENDNGDLRMLHVDPTVDHTLPIGQHIAIDTVIERSVQLIAHAEAFRRNGGLPTLSHEVGTEEVHGGLGDESTFAQFLAELRAGLASYGLSDIWPCFVVGKVGTDLLSGSLRHLIP